MAKVKVKHGSEGPAHDPYGYTEIVFTKTNGQVYRFRHGGLGYEYFYGPRGRVVKSYDRMDKKPDLRARRAFERATGMAPEKAEHVPDMLEARMLRRMSNRERWQYQACVDADMAMLRNAY